MAWQQAEAAFVAQCPDDIHDLTNERVVSIFALNCLQARHWVRVDYDAVLYRINVPIIVQCQCGVCYLSSKDSAVVWEPFGQLAASRRHHALVNLRYVSVNFSMWSLSIAILSELGLSLFCDHTFAHMLFGSYWCVRGERLLSSGGQTISTSISAEVLASSTLWQMGCAGGRIIPPWKIQISCGWVKFM